MMFVVKAMLMMLIPWYRVCMPQNLVTGDALYQRYVRGTIVENMKIKHDSSILKRLNDDISKNKCGWAYDISTYASNRTFVLNHAKINCMDNSIVINYSVGKTAVQVSKSVRGGCNLDKQLP